ncbi:MAG TPA: beta-ketoacyl-ACP synthase 3 [Solirubrobacterales bacterium]|nr:beta-ketoacyl-ACP synthase 3 [Solirubrobacterales bacterium]
MRSVAGAPLTARTDAAQRRGRPGIAAVARAVPPRVVANEEIASRLGVDGAWITTRTGIAQRRHAAPDATLVELAADAAAVALGRAGVEAEEIDQVLVATSTPDDLLPNAAPLVAERIGANRAGAMDVGAACTGFLAALELGAASVESGRVASSLVIGADLMSRILDFDDRRTAGLFGDGAGAVVVVPGGAGAIGPIRLRADGAGATHVSAAHGGKVRMDGRATFRAAVARLCEATLEVTAEADLELEQIDLFVYHQANSRILAAVGERLGLPADRVVDSLARYGNTSAASVPIALDEAIADGRVRPGSKVVVGAFGAGLMWGAGIVDWGGAE